MSDLNMLTHLASCRICPRNCGADRFGQTLGYCNSSAGFHISSICLHKGEEPVLGANLGVCNVFFSHCNLQCLYCQNYQISCNSVRNAGALMSLDEVVDKIAYFLDSGVRTVGFVSGSHFAYHCIEIVKAVRQTGRKPIFVYNTNAYDKVETIKMLEDYIDIYLPDFKYINPLTSKRLSGCADYFEYASKAIREMYRQKGSSLIVDDDGFAESGLIIRHLVLPGLIDESVELLRYIAEELSVSVHLSLMSQYYPIKQLRLSGDLGRSLRRDEYAHVVEAVNGLGFRKGWTQFVDSESDYRPDFERMDPFEH